jgi:hypothetical protein
LLEFRHLRQPEQHSKTVSKEKKGKEGGRKKEERKERRRRWKEEEEKEREEKRKVQGTFPTFPIMAGPGTASHSYAASNLHAPVSPGTTQRAGRSTAAYKVSRLLGSLEKFIIYQTSSRSR